MKIEKVMNFLSSLGELFAGIGKTLEEFNKYLDQRNRSNKINDYTVKPNNNK